MPMSFKPGMAVAWETNTRRVDTSVAYGLVLHASEEYGLVVAPVYCLDQGMRCYDEQGATYENDRDKVRLTECPRPFTKLCSKAGRGLCYADGNHEHFRTFSSEKALDDLMIVEGDYLVSVARRKEVIDHEWWNEWQREKLYVDDGIDPENAYFAYEGDGGAGVSLRESIAEGDFVLEPGLNAASDVQSVQAVSPVAETEDEEEDESGGIPLLSSISDNYEPMFL